MLYFSSNVSNCLSNVSIDWHQCGCENNVQTLEHLDELVGRTALFGTVSQVVTFLSRPVVGEVALLVVAIILLRMLPHGITGRFFRRGL